MKFTDNELNLVLILYKDYEHEQHEENTEWFNLGLDKDYRKNRAILASLHKKKVISYAASAPENKGRFNPIFKGENWNIALSELLRSKKLKHSIYRYDKSIYAANSNEMAELIYTCENRDKKFDDILAKTKLSDSFEKGIRTYVKVEEI